MAAASELTEHSTLLGKLLEQKMASDVKTEALWNVTKRNIDSTVRTEKP